MRDHPVIESILKTGYPNMVAQPGHAGIDFFGTEILVGDSIVEDPNINEVVIADQLDEFLEGEYGFSFYEAAHSGIDYYEDEVLKGEKLVLDPNRGAIILKDNLEAYLEQYYGFKFKTAE
jgi:hypothetical protein